MKKAASPRWRNETTRGGALAARKGTTAERHPHNGMPGKEKGKGQGPIDQALDILTRQFLKTEPQWLEHDVRYLLIPGRDEPQLYLSTRAT